jgi:hypothetical protein
MATISFKTLFVVTKALNAPTGISASMSDVFPFTASPNVLSSNPVLFYCEGDLRRS